MIMKIIAILSLILICWCHLSHHHIFMLINTSPLSLASEEFIPISEELTTTENTPLAETNEAVEARSQNEKKSDDDTLATVKIENPDGPSQGKEVKETELDANAEQYIEDVRNPKTAQSATAEEGDKSLESDKKRSSESVESSSKVDKGSHETFPEVAFPAESTDLKNTFGTAEGKSSNLSESESVEGNQIQHHDLGNESIVITSPKTEISNASEGVAPAPPSVHKEEEPIPSFMEWTQIQQKKLQESNLAHGTAASSGQTTGQNGHKPSYATSSQQNKSSLTGNQAAIAKSSKEDNAKNFASPDCGAKVIQSNPESQNANGVLSSSHDEYMLNKCGIPVWFVVELCEPLKIQKVSVGNLELFSSSPKDFEIGISDRYPTRDWTKLGPFTLPDIRAIHSINLPATNASTFGKFLRVNILSHHGTEHFCPLSLVRVNGISEYEVLESENTHPGDETKEESALYEEPVIDEQSTERKVTDKSVFGSAKDAVINIVKKAAQVLVKSDATKDSSSNTAAISRCRSLLQCLPNYEMPFRERVLSLLSCNFSNLLPFLNKNSPWCGWDYCHALFSKHSIGLPWQPEGFYSSIFGGPSVLHALCNYHRPLSKESCDALFITNVSSSADAVLGEGYINESLQSPTINVGTIPADIPEENVRIPPEPEPSSSGAKLEANEPAPSPQESAGQGQSSEPEQTTQQTGENGQIAQSEAQQVTPSPPSQSTNGNSEDAANPSPNNGQPHQQQQQKESVFVRLSNRIKTLERNGSLTSSYLEELSRRFKKQNEENIHINEGTKRFMNESRVKFKVLEDLYRFELRSLRRNTDEIRERLFNVQLQRSVLILLCLIQFVFLLSACIWFRRRCRQFQTQLENILPQTVSSGVVPITSVLTRHDSPHIVTIRKRLTSESVGSGLNSIDKSKKIKRKKKKLTDLKPVNVKVTGPSSAPMEYASNNGREFKFEYPTPLSAVSANDIPTSSFKENVNPEPSSLPFETLNKPATPTQTSMCDAPLLFSTKVDSPFSMISSTSANFLVDSGVSTSSRFALLASPGPSAVTKVVGLKRSGSLTSLGSSSLSSYSYGERPASQGVVNGHGDSHSQGSGSGNGKKRKAKGLKALMPKIFDR